MHSPEKSKGFTLLELSVVLVVIGLVIGGGLTLLLQATQQRQYDETTAKMEAIQRTLLDYRRALGRIPCPADITLDASAANFGVEGATSGTCTGGSPAATFSDGSNTLGGMVPTKALALPDDYAFDGWGHRIVYVVDKRFTATGAFTTHPITDETGSITIKERNGTNITKVAIEVLMSQGENGHGAYNHFGGSTRLYKNGITNVNEWDNCGCDAGAATSLDNVFVQSLPYQTDTTDPKTAFDDIVLYKTRSTLWALNEPTPKQDFIYVVDPLNCRVQKFSLTGDYVSQFGTCGVGGGLLNGQFN